MLRKAFGWCMYIRCNMCVNSESRVFQCLLLYVLKQKTMFRFFFVARAQLFKSHHVSTRNSPGKLYGQFNVMRFMRCVTESSRKKIARSRLRGSSVTVERVDSPPRVYGTRPNLPRATLYTAAFKLLFTRRGCPIKKLFQESFLGFFCARRKINPRELTARNLSYLKNFLDFDSRPEKSHFN